MLIAYWIIAGLLALIYLFAGGTKLVRPREALASSGMGWAADFPAGVVKLIGAVEVLGAVGLILPPITGIAPILAPIAAIGLVLVQLGAMIVHGRRREAKMIPANLVLAALAAAAAILGFLVWS
ncbi:DoxX family protein [Microbacterium schleiferi]|uniref:DoxX family protein n=1 Tax=Microbacterium schleiferi TaxID=69362 RepID=UPI00311FBF5C